jgi:hypothetical protein
VEDDESYLFSVMILQPQINETRKGSKERGRILRKQSQGRSTLRARSWIYLDIYSFSLAARLGADDLIASSIRETRREITCI